MFGYVRPCQPQLRVCEQEIYKAVYCGLCKQLGREYGLLSRFSLSYDFTFLALLSMALEEHPATFSPARCMINPLRPKPSCQKNEQLSFSCGVGMILLYFKLLDNDQDGDWKDRLLSMLAMPFARSAYRRAADRYPAVAQIAYETISLQKALEDERCASVDQASEPTAQALSGICALLSEDAGQKRVLSRFGYLLGRYIYLADALDDLEQDIRQKSYNPFLLQEQIDHPTPEKLASLRENAKGSLFLTIGELEKSFELLHLHHYRPILDNIVYLGLHEAVDRIMLPKEDKRHDRPL